MSSTENLKMTLQEILAATDRFSEANMIARGGFGKVYRGKSEEHGILAIKRLDRSMGQGVHEFGTEIALLSAYKHENLVDLVGFCDEDREIFLVYKFETNGSLDKHLHKKDLTWNHRLQICIDVARGLRYLHDEVGYQHRIIHRDVKSANILLDENWKAKISDFGLSKISLMNVPYSIQFSTACGTAGYVDPEFQDHDTLTQKSDVYSFGVVLFEVLFGKLVSDPKKLDARRFRVEMAKNRYENNTLDEIIDPDLRNQMTLASLRTFSTVAYQCMKNRSDDRPTMRLVVEELEKALGHQQVIKMPHPNKVLDGLLHDVYVSVRSDDNGRNIANELYAALEEKGLSVYKDNIKSSFNKSVALEAIKLSRAYIIVFSQNFADNSWNLDEAVEILECRGKRKQYVFPIFYGVTPSDVKTLTRFRDTLMFKSTDNNRSRVWRKALIEAADTQGGIITQGYAWSQVARGAASIIKDRLYQEIA